MALMIEAERIHGQRNVSSDRPTGTHFHHHKSSQSNRGIGEAVAPAGEVVVAAAMVVVTAAEDVDGADDSRSNVSHLCVGGAAAVAAAGSLKFRRCDTGGGRCCARALASPFAFAAPLPLALGAAAFLARVASSVSTYFCTLFSCTVTTRRFVRVGSGLNSSDKRRHRLAQRMSTNLHSPLHLELTIGGDGVKLDQLVHERLGEGHHVGVHHLPALADDCLQRRHLRAEQSVPAKTQYQFDAGVTARWNQEAFVRF